MFEYDKSSHIKQLSEFNLVKGDRLSITPQDWNAIADGFSKQDIMDHLTEIIKGLPFPYRLYSQKEVEEDWLHLKQEQATWETSAWMSDRVRGIDDFTYNGTYAIYRASNRGLKVSDQFSQPARMECRHERYQSPYGQWTRENFKDKKRYLLNPLFSVMDSVCRQRGVGDDEIFNSIRMYSFMASQFKPSFAKALYDLFGARRVLDFSMGWGDRLVGFYASSAESYVGIDPNSKLHTPYKEVTDWVSKYGVTKQTSFICSPAEDADLSNMRFDFIFTSPPYFDTERYSEEGTQSWKRHSSIDGWLNDFLFVTLKKCWDSLEDGGRIAINISDVFSTKGYKVICEPMLSYMSSLGATYEGILGYPLSKLPGTKTKQDSSLLCEPVFVWGKGITREPKWKQDNFFGV